MKKINFKERKIVIGGIFFLLLIVLSIIFINFKDNNKPLTDGAIFSEEYTGVDENNPFVYKSVTEIIEILENGTGVVYLGFPECKWCQRYVKYLNEVAYEEDIEKIYYYNIKEARASNTESYQKIVSIIGEYVPFDEEGKRRIYVPAVIYVNKGEIVGHDNETSMVSGDVDEYWTEEKVNALKERTRIFMRDSNPNLCNDGCND